MNKVQDIANELKRTDLDLKFGAGDTLKIHYIIKEVVDAKEGEKERIQMFQGVCIKKHNAGISSTFTVRKISNGVGVERIIPCHSPMIKKIEVLTRGKVRRSKLYYLRDLEGKKARIDSVLAEAAE